VANSADEQPKEADMSTTQQGTGWKVEHVDAVPPVKPDWPATWKSIRHHFGIQAFGINAVTKDAGNVLIPEHHETESGQQEVYFVHRGEVDVTLNGDTVRAGEGSVIAVEPGTSRKIEAASSPTTLLCIGGTPGKAYEVGPWEL
jgi:mannose-6-phosphate isomerase-like protein (cupin superfamily)